jgi:hypothetical protein
MRGGWEIKGRSSAGHNVDKVAGRLTRFESTYQKKVSLIDGQRWRYRRTGDSARPLVMLPAFKEAGQSFSTWRWRLATSWT